MSYQKRRCLLSNEIQKELDKIDLPEGYSIEMAGEDEMIADAMNQLYLMLLLAVIFIYLVMVAQFQSLLSPFIIMFTNRQPLRSPLAASFLNLLQVRLPSWTWTGSW